MRLWVCQLYHTLYDVSSVEEGAYGRAEFETDEISAEIAPRVLVADAMVAEGEKKVAVGAFPEVTIVAASSHASLIPAMISCANSSYNPFSFVLRCHGDPYWLGDLQDTLA